MTAAPGRPRCEFLIDPIGIDEMRPRLSWEVNDTRRGAVQSAYEVRVGTTPGATDLWESGRVESSAVVVEYAGVPLASRLRAWWSVRTLDAAGVASPWSADASFEMGLLGGPDWRARPVRAQVHGDRRDGCAAPFLRREFDVEGTVERARLYITALGLYEAEVNGAAATRDVYRPGWTDYRVRVPCQVYDVTALVRPGRNAIGVVLGDGWFCGHSALGRGRQTYGDRPVLLAQLEVQPQGVVVATDRDWRWTTGPILENDNYMGESYDARAELTGWSLPGYDDAAWQQADIAPTPLAALVATVAPPVRCTLEVIPVSVREVAPGVHLYDMGQNMVGRVRLRPTAGAGDEIVLRHAEVLSDETTIHTANLGRARATDRYVASGADDESWEPRFTFHGFRYVEVSGCVEAPAITGVVLHSDTEPTGSFECSNPLVSRLQENIVWSQRGNFLDVPTDCPQRYERLGWTGDAQVFARTAAFNMDVAAFFTKWLADVRDAQFVGGTDDGQYPTVVPRGPRLGISGGGPAWADAGVIVPWDMYLTYGDRRLLERQYRSLCQWMDFLERKAQGLTPGTWTGFGDWLSLDVDPENLQGPDDRFGGTPVALIASAFHAHAADLMVRIASAIGAPDDWPATLAMLRDRFGREWVRDGRLAVRTQTAALLGLRFDLVDAEVRRAVFADLVDDVESRGHLTTGFVGTPYLLHVLSDGGRTDLAYRLLEREEYPGWLYPVTMGATTIWERWNALTDEGINPHGMNSFNHYAYGAVGHFLYRVVGGIDVDPDGPGYERILIAPKPGGTVTWAKTSLKTMRGTVSCGWELRGGSLHMDVTIPPNASSTVTFPTRATGEVTESGAPLRDAEGVSDVGDTWCRIGAGTYSFTIPDPTVAR